MNGEPQLLCDMCGDAVHDELPHMTGRRMLTVQFDHTVMDRLFPPVAAGGHEPALPIYAEDNYKLVAEIVDKLLRNMMAEGVDDKGGYRHMRISHVLGTRMPQREFRIRVRYGDGDVTMFQYGEMGGAFIPLTTNKKGDEK
jgi:hypothetical protein